MGTEFELHPCIKVLILHFFEQAIAGEIRYRWYVGMPEEVEVNDNFGGTLALYHQLLLAF